MKKITVLRGEECSNNAYKIPFSSMEEAYKNLSDEENPWWIYPKVEMVDLNGSDGIYLVFDRKSQAGNENWRLVMAPVFKGITTSEISFPLIQNEYNFFGKGSWEPIGASYGVGHTTMTHYELEVVEVKKLGE